MANLFTTAELNAIKKDVQDIVRDTSINTTLRYRQYKGEDYYDAEDQTYSDLYTNWSGVSALKGVVGNTEVSEAIQLSDIKFVIMQSGVSNVLSISDVIVEGGVTYNVVDVRADPIGVVYQIFARGA